MAQPSYSKFSRHRMYSTLSFGLIFTLFTYGGILFIFDRKVMLIPSWLWFLGFPILAVGLLLQFLCTRMLWIRVYQSATSFLAGLINAIALWLILQSIQSAVNAQFTGWLIIVLFLLCISGSYYRTLSRYRVELRTMPHGVAGTIASDTGLINPEITPKYMIRRMQASSSKNNQLNKLIPLAIGLAFYVMKMYGSAGNIAIVILLSFGFAVTCAITGGVLAVYVVSIYRWETQYQIRLHLQQ